MSLFDGGEDNSLSIEEALCNQMSNKFRRTCGREVIGV